MEFFHARFIHIIETFSYLLWAWKWCRKSKWTWCKKSTNAINRYWNGTDEIYRERSFGYFQTRQHSFEWLNFWCVVFCLISWNFHFFFLMSDDNIFFISSLFKQRSTFKRFAIGINAIQTYGQLFLTSYRDSEN